MVIYGINSVISGMEFIISGMDLSGSVRHGSVIEGMLVIKAYNQCFRHGLSHPDMDTVMLGMDSVI